MSTRRNSYKNNEPLRDSAESAPKERSRRPHDPTPIMLINEVGRLWHGHVEDGSPEEFRQKSNRAILRELSIRDGVFQLDLAESTHLKPPTVSVTLGKLEADGIIFRAVDKVDQRATRVYLTEKGRGLNANLHARLRKADAIALEGFSDEEKATLNAMLGRMIDNLIDGKSSDGKGDGE